MFADAAVVDALACPEDCFDEESTQMAALALEIPDDYAMSVDSESNSAMS
jgi:hypothetical protein